MKTLSISNRSVHKEIKIEAPGCLILIKVGLSDASGNEMTYVSVSADGNRYAGSPEWWVATSDGRIVGDKSGVGLRIVKSA